ncbi:hypothetical protein GUY59_27530 [Nonomuraea sp. K271]|nr:hypothetical protein [Nonomuraea sp. K271]
MIAVRRDVVPSQIADLLHVVANALIERGWQPGVGGTERIRRLVRAARHKSRYRPGA